MAYKTLLWILFCYISYASTNPVLRPLNYRPIIGILEQRITGHAFPHLENSSYIAASYVKFIESAGGRVVPIFTNHTHGELVQLFRSINGVLLPGGSASMITSPYYKTAKVLFELAQKANDVGDYFPIWATCLGFETLQVLRSNDDTSILSSCDSNDNSWPLNFTIDATTSRLFHTASKKLMKDLEEQDITYNHHEECVYPGEYVKRRQLKNFFRILSTNRDIQGREFVSTIEAIDYPFYGVQWHPEKNSYEWTTSEKINHSPDAISATQYTANFFLSEARKNNHKFATVQDETNSLIYNYCPRLTIGITHFEEFYVF